jgi:hypothetical protein
MSGGFKRKNKNKNGVNSMIGCRTKDWWSYISRYSFEWKYFSRAFLGTLIVLIGIPFRMWERFRVGKKIENTQIHESPVFIIGHWRGGTTLLHNLLSKDKQFGYTTYLQGLFPHSFLTNNFFAWIAKNIMPSKRPMDNMDININSPQEEELILMCQSGHSIYNMWVAPKNQMEVWKQYGRLEDPHYRKLWSDGYIQMLKTSTFNFKGKRLLLKNPPNTARIPYLIEQFPNAKFIHIYRNPYQVYASTYKLYRDVLNFFQFHDEVEEDVDNNILEIYKDVYDSYNTHKHLIPKENLLEVKFEDFVKDKEKGLKEIYEKLNLGDYSKMEPTYKEYLSSIKSYKKNKLRNDDEVIDIVNKHWAFAFKDFGYDMEKVDDSVSS